MSQAGNRRNSERAPIAVLGAGIAGLTAANELSRRGHEVRVFEAGKAIAGMAQSFRDERGFKYDFGAHLITNRLAAALGISGNCYTVTHYNEAVLLRGRSYSFPVGLLRSPRYVMSALRSRLRMGSSDRRDESAAGWYRANYGKLIAEEIAIPLVEAWSGVTADTLSSAVIPPHVDRGTGNVLKLKLAGLLSGRAVANGYSREKAESPHVWHVYPKGGVSEICNRLAARLDQVITLESRVESIRVENNKVQGIVVGGREVEASAVISTAPVHVLPKLVRGSDALDHLARFRYRPIVLVMMLFSQRPMLPAVATWVPDRTRPFFRLTEVPQSIPFLAPDGMTTINVDIGCDTDSDLYKMSEDDLGRLCLDHLESLFPGARQRFIGCHVVRTPVGYPVYLREYENERRALDSGLPIEGLYSVGRNAEFAHILMEDVYWRALEKVRHLRNWLDGDVPASDIPTN